MIVKRRKIQTETPPEIDLGKRLAAAIRYNKTCGLFFDGPARREAALRHSGVVF
jgi:hypothetical protein